LCTGDSLIVNGTTYNAANPSGIELIANGTVNGCDSVINVMLTFGDASINDVVQTLCPGESLIVNGVTYDELNPMGSDTIQNGNAMGCDSIININLSFFTTDTLDIEDQLCFGESLIVNGTTYDALNPSGIEVISDGSINGCDSVINVNLTFEMEVIEMINDTLCPGEFIEVNNIVYDEANPSGEEIIVGGSVGGCDSVIQVNLTYFEQASGFLSGSTAVCEGDSAFLTINLVGGPLFNVSISNGTSNIASFSDVTDGFTFGVLPTETTTYNISLLTAIGSLCTVDIGATATVTVEEAAVSVSVDTDYDGFGVSCADSEDAIVSATATEGSAFLWNTGSNSNQLMNVGPGTYIVTITTSAGCMAVDSAIVTAPPQLAAKVSGISANCLDPLNGSILFENLSGGTPPYEYSLDGVFFQSLNDFPATIPNIEPGAYDLIIQDVNDCLVETTVFIGESEELSLELGEDEEIKLGDSILIDPIALFDVDTFFWAPQEGLLDSVSFATFASPSITTTYQLTAVDSLGCSVSDYITIIVNTQGSVYTPNVFSPNGDGRNDFFTIFTGNDVAEVTVFRIFDRWGDMVFESSPLQPNIETLGWDGNFNGEPMDPAVFVFYAEIQYVDGRTEVIKGDVTLIR
ncbi:MAG: gliding motility-associated C-terminal domain-containing protein, partial [Chitinophagales bacterium]|nr:gliding motility-associated C-terminal domain-containing protein [Chitinophagales bacterium]